MKIFMSVRIFRPAIATQDAALDQASWISHRFSA